MTKLSVITVSFNTKTVLQSCIVHLHRSLKKTPTLGTEIIVVDNGSTDGTIEMLQEVHPNNGGTKFKIIKNERNNGFGRANNQGIQKASGEYILFLNSDVIVKRVDFEKLLAYMDAHPRVGALTVRVVLGNGQIDPASHRGFPTLWRSLCYFSGLERFFGHIPFLDVIFGGYHLIHLSTKTIHDIDSPSGAFILTRRSIMKKLRGFDERFFMYGEDLDLSYRIKQAGYRIVYHPRYVVEHLKYVSGLRNRDEAMQNKIKDAFYEAMKIFYTKHYEKRYSKLVTPIVFFLIDAKRRLLHNRH